jgi:ferrochelatase
MVFMVLAPSSAPRPRAAVLVVGHGTVHDLADVPEFLRRIRRGRPAPATLIDEIRRRYTLIGGSPLLETTNSLGSALAERLGVPVWVAMRFWTPLIEDRLTEILRNPPETLCVLPLAPFSVHVYANVVTEALGALPSAASPRVVSVDPYGSDPAMIDAHVRTIAPALRGRDPETTDLVLTAHSLPVHVIQTGDPYQIQFEASARAIARALEWPVRIAYQSQGEGGGDWLGPSLAATLEDARSRGKRDVVVAPVGFLADHVETLYDLDVEAAEQARALGLGFVRTPALGVDARLVDALAGVARRALS